MKKEIKAFNRKAETWHAFLLVSNVALGVLIRARWETEIKAIEITKKSNTFSKLAEYKIYIQKSVVFLYTSNEPAKKEVRKEKSHSQYHKK